MKLLILCFIYSINCFANTNSIFNIIGNDPIDIINNDMKDRYRLHLKKDHSLRLTGYNVQDCFTKLIRTYSVLRVEF